MIEAMKQALADAKRHERHSTVAETRYWCKQYKLLAERLIAAAEESSATQEPVAWEHLKAYGYAPGSYMMTCRGCNIQVIDVDKRAARCRSCAEAAYAKDTHPPKREWVGLTDDDYQELLEVREWGVYLIEAVEAKLKEKNT